VNNSPHKKKCIFIEKIGRFWNIECILGNFLLVIAKLGQLYQNKKANKMNCYYHDAVIHTITFFGTLVVICLRV